MGATHIVGLSDNGESGPSEFSHGGKFMAIDEANDARRGCTFGLRLREVKDIVDVLDKGRLNLRLHRGGSLLGLGTSLLHGFGIGGEFEWHGTISIS